MANRTAKDARTVHGTNPQYLVEKIIRTRIYECRYWKEECFGLTADLIVDKGSELRYIGGTYGGNIKIAPFLCLTLKLLQIQPEKDIVIEYIRQEHFKYLRALGVFYLRLTGSSLEIYKYLEPLYNDFRKLRRMDAMGQFDIVYMDEFIEMLLREDRVFDIILPRLTKRFLHVENGELQGPRESLVNIELADEEEEDNNEMEEGQARDNEDRVAHSSRNEQVEKDRTRYRRSPETNRRHHRSRRSRSPREDDRHRRNRRDENKSSKRHRHASPSPEALPSRSGKPKTEAEEIAEMNALRAKLGLKPLRP